MKKTGKILYQIAQIFLIIDWIAAAILLAVGVVMLVKGITATAVPAGVTVETTGEMTALEAYKMGLTVTGAVLLASTFYLTAITVVDFFVMRNGRQDKGTGWQIANIVLGMFSGTVLQIIAAILMLLDTSATENNNNNN